MRMWLSGRASPCQGEGREFESRHPLHFLLRRHSQVVRQRSATPLPPVQIWVAPPKLSPVGDFFIERIFMLIISYKASRDFKNFLKVNGYQYIETIPNPNLDPRIADHPDLSLFKLNDDTIVVDREVFSYYKENLSGIKLIEGESVGKKYPQDALYNIVSYKEYYIHNDFTEKNIRKYFDEDNIKHLKVKQGYTRCSLIPLPNLLISSDYGIYKSLRDKIEIRLVDNDSIELDGFEQGFLGGTCGLVADKLIFTGDISQHKAFSNIKEICEKEKIEIIFPNTKLVDLGSIIEI